MNHENEKDGELLKEFVANSNEHSFARLIERHGKMVLAVCQRTTVKNPRSKLRGLEFGHN